MQSTEEYLDQLLASVSDEEPKRETDTKAQKAHRKSIEELDESELTEEVLQKQLALLLGLETEEEDDYFNTPEEDFMSQYTEQLSAQSFDTDIQDIVEEASVAAPELKAEESVENHVADVATVSVEPVSEPAPAISNTGVLSDDEIAALFASMEAENSEQEAEEVKEAVQETVKEEPAPAVSNTGVLSDDEIAALFASVEAENSEPKTEEVKEAIQDAIKEEIVAEKEAAPVMSDSGMMSQEEIAALFAAMETEEPAKDESGGLTREELEELGLSDIADVLVDGEAEILAETSGEENSAVSDALKETEDEAPVSQVVEFSDFDFDEEVLLDLENVEEMLEATAKLAEEESVSFDADMQAEEDIMSMLSQFEEESIQENAEAIAESTKAAEEAVSKALEPENDIPAELAEEAETGKKRRKKEKKSKVSLKDRITAFMFEDDSTEDGKVPLGEGDSLEYMDIPSEETPAKPKKEKAPKKSKKTKAEKQEKKAKDENAEIAAELAAEDKKKAKKKEKPKKEKKVKKVVIADDNNTDDIKEKKRGIGTKGIVATLLVCASVLGLILVGTYFLPQQLSLAAARVAFYAQDYEETALRLKDKSLNESDRIMYEKASLLYGLEERFQQAEIYAKRGMIKENLDALLQGVVACNEESVLAGQLGIETEWKLQKDRFIKALQEQYGLDAETVEAVCALRNPNYTVAVENILAGRMYNDMSAFGGEAVETPEDTTENVEVENETEDGLNPEEMEDLLPEEEAIIEQLQQEGVQTSESVPSASEEYTDDLLYSGNVEGGAVNFVE